MGTRPGDLEHPHYVAVSNTNRVVVSDSNNHRIQIFDVNGKVISTFGEEGTGKGQFKFPRCDYDTCLVFVDQSFSNSDPVSCSRRGVAVDEQGYIFVADSGNNRIQASLSRLILR